jgi:carbon monoxide dehydrogenase subunit G
MKLVGEYRFEIPREQVWKALLDAEVLSRCLPGFERLEEVGENDFEGALNMRVGPVQGKFQGHLTLSELDPPSGYRLQIKGQGPAGFVNGKGTLTLEDEGDGTLLQYDMDAQIGGKIAGVGQRLLDSSARAISDQALAELGKIVSSQTEASQIGVEEDLPAAPSEAEFAARVAKEVVSDLVPPERRALWVTAALAIVVLVIVVLFRSCGS